MQVHPKSIYTPKEHSDTQRALIHTKSIYTPKEQTNIMKEHSNALKEHTDPLKKQVKTIIDQPKFIHENYTLSLSRAVEGGYICEVLEQLQQL